MTEDEARTRWCPFARAWSGPGAPVALNRVDDQGHTGCHCLASRCMAWRWHISGYHGRLNSGYCGLAGKPASYQE